MTTRIFMFTFALFVAVSSSAQELSGYIIVDQFGYLPGARKTAVLKDPQEGFDAGASFSPGLSYSVVNATSGEKVYRAARVIWGNRQTDASSGDKAWHFDFSEVTEPGTYYVLDDENNLRSYDFVISHNVYNEVLRQAMRSFYYQRAGFRKEAEYAGAAWADRWCQRYR